MFKWAANLSTKVASSLSDTFAPLFRSPLEQLQDAWRKAEAECQTLLAQTNAEAREQGGVEPDDPRVLLDSPLVTHLNQMVEALMREEEEQAHRGLATAEDTGSVYDSALAGSEAAKSATGPCFEYFLHEKILDKLCAIGTADRPVGMRQLVTKTLDAVLLNTRHPILPSMSVHLSVRQLLEVCFTKEDHKRRGYRSAFLSLLHTIALKIKQDNSLVGIFFDIFPPQQNKPPEFLLFTALCALMSESNDGARAYEALLWIVQLPNASVCQYVLQHSEYVAHTLTSLSNLFRSLPPAVESPLMDVLVAGQYEAVDMFFRRWTYVDTLLRSSYDPMQAAVSQQLLDAFLLPIVQPMLLDNREAVAIWTTNCLKHLCLNAESPALRHTLMQFMIGNDLTPERPPPTAALVSGANTPPADVSPTAAAASATAATPNGSSSSPPISSSSSSSSSPSPNSSAFVRNILLKRLDSLSDTLCIHTLDLFQTLIGLRDPIIIQNLILRNLPQQQQQQQLSFPATSGTTSPSPTSSIGIVPVDILPLSQAAMFVDFHDLPEFGTQGLEEYLLDTQYEAQLWMQAWDNPDSQNSVLSAAASAAAAAAVSPKAASPAIDGTQPFFEGLFLSTLLNKLECLYENSFATNLKLTSVLAKLSYCPSPALHQYLFNPAAKIVASAVGSEAVAVSGSDASNNSESVRTVLGVLSSVWNKGMKRASRIQNFARKKEEARQRLNQYLQTNAAPASSSVESMDGERFLRGLILLEEFLKEFFAISHSKARLFELAKFARLAGTGVTNATGGTAAGTQALSPRGVISPRGSPIARQISSSSYVTSTPVKSPVAAGMEGILGADDSYIALSPAPTPTTAAATTPASAAQSSPGWPTATEIADEDALP